jgi:hypothetical protein
MCHPQYVNIYPSTEEHNIYLSKGSIVFHLQPTTLTVKILQEIEVLSKRTVNLLQQFELTNARNFIKITIILQHTSFYMFRPSSVHHQGAHNCTKQLFNLLKPSGFFTYHQVQHSKILHGARFALSVLYGSHNKQRLLLYTSLTDWFL